MRIDRCADAPLRLPADGLRGDMRTFSQWIGYLIISLYPKSEVDGIRVIFTDIEADRPKCKARLHRALDAGAGAGRRYDALLKRIRYFVIHPGDTPFADSAGGIHIPSADLLGLDEFALASVLIHESVHLRISARGIQYEPQCRERIERLCVKEQARFLRTVPDGGEEMAREAEELLAFPWWTPEQREADLKRLFDEHNIPQWLRGIVRRG